MELSKPVVLGFVAVVLIVVGVVAVVQFDVLDGFTLYGYAKEVPIQSMSYNTVSEYWVLGTVVNEVEGFKLVLEEDTSQTVDGDSSVVAQSEVGILLEPLRPTSTTSMTVYDLDYRIWPAGHWWEDQLTALPAFAVNVDSWLTSARYSVSVYRNKVNLVSQNVEVNYKTQKVVTLATSYGDVQIDNLGYLPNGVSTPASEAVVLVDPYGNERLYSKTDLNTWVNNWNDLAYWSLQNDGDGPNSYEDFWSVSAEHGFIPAELSYEHVSTIEYTSDMSYVTLTYSDIVFAGNIVIRVPAEMADTVVVEDFDPVATITSVVPSPLPSLEEGQQKTFEVSVRNDGSYGTISVTCTSTAYSVVPLDATSYNLEGGESVTVEFLAYALNVMESKSVDISILAQGGGGSDTFTLEGYIESVEGYTPEIPEDLVPEGDGDGEGEGDLLLWVVVGCVVVLVAVGVVVFFYRRD